MKINAARARKKAVKYQLRNLYKIIHQEIKCGHQQCILYGENLVLFPENINNLLEEGYTISLTITTNRVSIYTISWEYSRDKTEGEYIKFDHNKINSPAPTVYFISSCNPEAYDETEDDNDSDSE